MTNANSNPVYPLFEQARIASRRLTKDLFRPIRKVAKIVAQRRMLREAIASFLAYDQSLEQQDRMDQPAPSETVYSRRPVHVVYFCCHRDFHMLHLSLASLLKYGSSLVDRIYIYEDLLDPFSSDEHRALGGLPLPVSIVPGPRVTGWGAETLIRELVFFREMLPDFELCRGWIVKIDSDVLFLNERMFTELEACDSDLFGQPYTNPCGYTYCQGGCYAISAALAGKIVTMPLSQLMQELSVIMKMPLFRLPEDACIFHLSKQHVAQVTFSDYYLPAQRISSFIPSQDENAGLIHFESGLGRNIRQHMPRIGEQLKAA